jgi:AcrR family transcriptional regulator
VAEEDPTRVFAQGEPKQVGTRYRLMDAAARLMAHQGYVGTSVRAIAARAGLTTGAMYAQFPGGKEELFLAIVASVGREVQLSVADSLSDAADPVDAVVRLAGGLWDFLADYPSFAALLQRENISGALGDPSPFVEQNAAMILQLRALFDHAVAEGQIAPMNVSFLMFWIFSTCTAFHGCQPLREVVWTPQDLATARADYLGTLRRMLTPPARVAVEGARP